MDGEGGGCAAQLGSWSSVADAGASPGVRASASGFWTGSELLVWGGYSGELESGGALYDPASKTWRSMSSEGAPSPRAQPAAVWTGDALFVWGGVDDEGVLGDGALYDLATDSWQPLPREGAPSARAVGAAVWTGTEVIVWGGATLDGALATGARFDAKTARWVPMATNGAPEARNVPAAAWTGAELVVWGGFSAGSPLGSGGRYDPVTDTWAQVTTEGAPSPRTSIAGSAIWTGERLFVWGGHNGSFAEGVAYGDGGLYDPARDRWETVSTTCAPQARAGHTAVWVDGFVVVWGGQLGNLPFYERLASGAAYDPARDVWTELAPAPLAARDEHVMVSSGTAAIIWGGYSGEPVGTIPTGYADGAELKP